MAVKQFRNNRAILVAELEKSYTIRLEKKKTEERHVQRTGKERGREKGEE